MARKLTPQEHADAAVALLDESRSKGIASPARSVILAEAQIHATLALFASPQEPSIVPLTDEPIGTSAHEALEAQVAEAKPATKRRTRKAPASPASAEEAAK